MPATGVKHALRPRLERLVAAGIVPPEERRLAGAVSGVLFIIGGVTAGPLTVLPGVPHNHIAMVLVIAGVACTWGTLSLLLIDWDKAPPWLIHISGTGGVALVIAAIATTGGGHSPAWVYFFFVVVFAAYFWRPPAAVAYFCACVVAQASVLLYDPHVTQEGFFARLEIAAPAFFAVGGAILAGKALMSELRSRAERLAAEQGSLRRVATAVVEAEPTEQIYELVAREAAALLGGGAAGILRFDGWSEVTVLGSWADHEGGRYEPGTAVPVRPGSDLEQALTTNKPVRIEGHPPDSPVGRLGYTSSIVAPIRVAGSTWGILAVTAAEPAQLTAEDEQRLVVFGDLLATAIGNIEDRAKLAAQASTDPLTGLANHRTLHERLTAEVSRAVRHSGTLSVAIIDIDNFKQINDAAGHEAGDDMLVGVARCLADHARAEDTLGRAGGDEFTWIMPETSREQALVAVERVRRLIATSAAQPYRLTVSAGICDINATKDPTELTHLADGALYWSKAHGRNRSWIYDPVVVQELSAQERADRLERSRALLGLRALARAIDAKDPATREHSERVSALVGKLARAAGWSAERSILLSEAALVHDVGKIGVPDALLRKVGPLTAAERDEVEGHAELAARIVEGVLGPEQVEWIRTHHERPDGGGYPRGLREREIPEGAALLAIADAWDVMTMSRPYSTPKSEEAALQECAGMAGTQFTQAALDALVELHRRGELRSTESDQAPAGPFS